MRDVTVVDIRSFFSSFQRKEITGHMYTSAGVLVPLVTQGNELSVVLTQRTQEVAHHKGQVSFPGGMMEEIDPNIIETALREAEEEIGLSRNSVEVLGLLNDFCTPSGFCITPVVGFLPFTSSFVLNKTEVSGIFDVPLSFFLDPHNERREKRERSGKQANIYFYNYGNYEIWGTTAEILRTFLQALNTEINHKKTL
jgi:8-oxo-dGTP pyrophosphatase MutT (NUDIX family)